MLNRELALDEARKQKKALAEIGGWRRVLFLLTAFLSAAAFGFFRSGRPVLGVTAAVAAAVCFLLTCVVDLSIRNGRRNVERILDSLK